MKICFLVDARSPIAQNWIRCFIAQRHDVDVISTYPFSYSKLPGASLHTVPVAFSRLARVPHDGTVGNGRGNSLLKPLLAQMRTGKFSGLTNSVHHWIGPLDVYRHVGEVKSLLEEIKPDFLHAMRLPFEGILASLAAGNVPLLVSTWGNDLTLFARSFPLVGRMTRQALTRANALHCDCSRDLRLATNWGFDSSKPGIVLPGNGGVQRELFHQGRPDRKILKRFSLPEGRTFIINPRGVRPYVRNDAVFSSLPLILRKRPDAFFLAVAMEGNPVAEQWVEKLGIGASVRLLPLVSPETMAELFRLASVTVSPSDHDGTPNTLLEAMACGCFPIAGDIESLREWITNGVNGLLCDPSNPESLADAVVRALEDEDLRRRAASANQKLIDERAEYQQVMKEAEDFYLRVIETSKRAEACVG